MRYRIGCFFTIVGFITLLTFYASVQAEDPAVGLFCAGGAVLLVGAVLMIRGYQKPTPSGRFGTINKFRNRPQKQKIPKKGQ